MHLKSTILFNIYLADLEGNIASPENSPALITQQQKLGCLIWADDLLLLSETEAGLNNMLDTLKQYTLRNGLKINVDKTKVMIFNKT